MSEVIAFPRPPTPARPLQLDIAEHASNEYVLIALADRDSRLGDPAPQPPYYIDFACVLAGLDGVARFLKISAPGLADADVAHHLATALAFYNARKLGVTE